MLSSNTAHDYATGLRMLNFRQAGALLLGSLIQMTISQHSFANDTANPGFDHWLEMLDEVENINEGTLNFLPLNNARDSADNDYALDNKIQIDADSRETGWIGLTQCHSNLGAIPRLSITFGKRTTRDLQVLSYDNIDRAVVDGQNVEIYGAGENARICIKAQMNTLQKTDGAQYELKNGPYLRRFLDGYFPMHVSLDIDFSRSGLSFERVTPAPQKEFKVVAQSGHVNIETTFEGRLEISTYFR